MYSESEITSFCKTSSSILSYFCNLLLNSTKLSLLLKALWQVGLVGTFGANKYKPDSWQGVEQDRYKDALLRHLFLYFQGEKIDEESGLNHLSHVAWNALAILNMELENEHTGKN